MRWLALILLACTYVALGARQVPVWTSEPALWRHALEQAPIKDRPAANYAKALFAAGRVDDARRVLAYRDAVARMRGMR